MKKLCLTILLFLPILSSDLFSAVPECNTGIKAYTASIDCIIDKNERIRSCTNVKLDFLEIPTVVNNDPIRARKLEDVDRYLCLGTAPGKIGNEGQDGFGLPDGIGYVSVADACKYLKFKMSKPYTSRFPIYVGVYTGIFTGVGVETDMYQYTDAPETFRFSEGTHNIYAHVYDLAEMTDDHGDPNYDGYMKSYCDDVTPTTITIKMNKIKE